MEDCSLRVGTGIDRVSPVEKLEIIKSFLNCDPTTIPTKLLGYATFFHKYLANELKLRGKNISSTIQEAKYEMFLEEFKKRIRGPFEKPELLLQILYVAETGFIDSLLMEYLMSTMSKQEKLYYQDAAGIKLLKLTGGRRTYRRKSKKLNTRRRK